MNIKVDFEGHQASICECDLLVPPEEGDFVVAIRRIGEEVGRIIEIGKHLNRLEPKGKVVRYATVQDKIRWQEIREREIFSLQLAKQRVVHFGLPMKVVAVEYDSEESKIRLFFVSEERIDFRELVRDLAKHLHCRVDLRQIGVRDYATRLGGIGACGRETCCSTFLQDFKPITLQIAREQNLNLNTQKLSGLCGRLMCCLMYEWEMYKEASQYYPSIGSKVKTTEGDEVEVVSTHIYQNCVTVKTETGVMKTLNLQDINMKIPPFNK
ncbi:stage 0 sporulation protein [candidate division WOR-3 bacterium]|nr:stage 0 sporulation protein [candidate division WOR-3 bacterium]